MADNGAANERLIWIDLEMTGLDTDNDSIIEIATLVTDAQLNVLAEGPEFAIHHPLETLEAMDEWNRNQHRRSGLWQRVVDSTTTLAQAAAVAKSEADYAAALAARGMGPITTECAPAGPFYFAEAYHQQYLHKNPGGYCGLQGTGVFFPN